MQEKKLAGELEFGDIIKLNFSPTEGHEQAGYRPALILTHPKEQNNRLNGMVSVVPITQTNRGFPTHVSLDLETITQGCVLMEHQRMVDLNSRDFRYVEKMSENKLKDIKMIFEALYENLLSL